MGVNLMLMSLTTAVHLLTPQSINRFGVAQRGIFTRVQCVNTPTLPRFHCEPLTAATTTQKVCFLSHGCLWFLRDGYHWWDEVSGVGALPLYVQWMDAGEHLSGFLAGTAE